MEYFTKGFHMHFLIPRQSYECNIVVDIAIIPFLQTINWDPKELRDLSIGTQIENVMS